MFGGSGRKTEEGDVGSSSSICSETGRTIGYYPRNTHGVRCASCEWESVCFQFKYADLSGIWVLTQPRFVVQILSSLVEVAEAIIWNHEKNCYIGIFNSSDLIKAVLMQINMHRHNPQSVDDILLININTYRGAFLRFLLPLEFQLKQSKNSERLLDCQPTTSLMDILRIMSQYRIRRLPVIQVRLSPACYS